MADFIEQTVAVLTLYTFVYPLVMSYVWMAGAIAFYWRFERNDSLLDTAPPATDVVVSILVPCHNEEKNVEEVVRQLLKSDYPEFEVIAINDGSLDRTADLLDALAATDARLRVVHLARNQGKAVALETAAKVARGEILIGIDGDALLEADAVRWLVRHFEDDPKLGAVTGNPRIRTRSTTLGRIQVGEFSSIVGLIKRAQHFYGYLFTVSGVIVAFRRSAIAQVGYWSHDMLTDDIDISWKLQTAGWRIRYEPNARVWILMPETLAGLWRQRLRWAMGGVQVIGKFRWIVTKPEQRRLWPIFLEYAASLVWAHLMVLSLLLSALGHFIELPSYIRVGSLVPGWTATLIASTCLMQFVLSLALDSRYDVRLFRYFAWMIWYPIAYWMINMLTSVWAVPQVLLRPQGQRAIWVSPDRGLQERSG